MDEWDELDKQVSPGWSAGPSAPPPSWDDLDKQVGARVRSAKNHLPEQPDSDIQPIGTESFEGSKLQFGPITTPIPIPSSVGRGLAQLGSGFADVGLGSQQLLGLATKADVDEKRRIDAPLTAGPVGSFNNLVGKVAPFTMMPYGVAPTALKGAGPLLEGALTGAAQGALEPVATGESRGANVALGAGAGSIFPAITGGLRRAGRPDEKLSGLVAEAQREGIPLSTADVTTNRLIKAFRSFADDLPFTGGTNEALRDRKQEAFNKAVGSRWGSEATKHTEDQRLVDKKKITDVMDRVWGNNNLPFTNATGNDLRTDFQAIRKEAEMFDDATKNTVNKHLDDFERQMMTDPNGFGMMPGKVAKNYQTDWYDKFGNKGGGAGQADRLMMNARQKMLDRFNQSVTGKDADDLTRARSQYRAFKSALPALQKADAGVAQRQVGDVRPVDLSAAVMTGYKGAPGSSPFGDLPQIGQQFLRDTTPQTGGSMRAMVQNSALAGGALTGTGLLVDPITSLTLGGATLGLNKMLNSPGFREAIQSPKVRPALGHSDATAATLEYLEGLLKKTPALMAPAGLRAITPRVEVRGTRDDDKERREPSPLESTER
jgi:hypothetical protein